MDDTEARQRAYRRPTLRLTGGLLSGWAAVGFLPGWFAEEMNQIVLVGWPFGLYMAGQGALIVFLLIVWIYDRWMVRLERRHGLGGES